MMSDATIHPSRLRCEYLTNPLGIDVCIPRLSWIVESSRRGQKQTAYRVLVASSPEILARNEGDLWDSGKIDSDQTLHVEYAGLELTSRMQCFWKVRVWDVDGVVSPWSESALWTMGLLKAEDWQAEWIACGTPFPRMTYHGYLSTPASSAETEKWVMIDLGGSRSIDAVQLHAAVSAEPPYTQGYLFPIRYKIEMAQRADFSDAVTVVDETADDVANPGIEPLLYTFPPRSARYIRLIVTKLADCRDGTYAFALSAMQVLSTLEGWPKPNAPTMRQNVAASTGSASASDSVESDGWSITKLCAATYIDGQLRPKEYAPGPDDKPATMVRKEFDIPAPIRRATVSVTGLGLYELRINGRRVGDQLLAPEYTRYKNRIQYQTYDVTDFLHKGANAVGAQISGGWYTGPLWCMATLMDAHNCLLLRIDIELADGSTKTIVTDSTWQASIDGPIRRTGIYYGEAYDATKEQPGWDEPGFDASGWSRVIVLPHPDEVENVTLSAQRNEPIRVTQEIYPVAVAEPSPGVYVFDMGQNMAGWCRIKADAPKGTRITLRYAEVLDNDGTIYTANLRADATNEYTWPGGEAELEPHFTYHGFRYVEVTGLAYQPTLDAIVGRVIHSSAPEAGTFACSNELVNRIMGCIQWTQRDNMHSVPTDCPQRSERLGWGGDAQAFSQTAIFNRDMAGFFSKWTVDLRNSQADDGRYPDMAPHPGDPNQGINSAPAWADAGTIIPWRVYQNYADTRIIAEHFESAKRWVDYVHAQNPNLLWRKGQGSDYSDWLNGDVAKIPGFPLGKGQVPKDIFSTAFFAHSTEIVAKMAAVLGLEHEAAKYRELFEGIKSAFNSEFVDEDGRMKGDTQAGYGIALNFNLLDENTRPKAIEHLLRAIEEYKGHPSAGLQTTHRMMRELSKEGRHGDAWRMINQRTAPSWGYMIDQGATTIWERWDAYVEGGEPWGGFQHPDMNSLNHPAFGSVGEWIWRNIAGINHDESQPGYKHFTLQPRMAEGLTWTRVRYDSIRGPIVCNTRIENEQLLLDVEIPANTTATVYVPAENVDSVFESNMPAIEAKGVQFVGMNDDAAVFIVASGRYSFCSKQASVLHE